MKPIRRFIIAGVVPFLVIFSATLLQYKVIFALGGMVNHTLVDKTTKNATDVKDIAGTCIAKNNQKLYNNGPFAWTPAMEGMIVSTNLVGSMAGMVLALFIYNYLDMRLVLSSVLVFSGILSVVTPVLSLQVGDKFDSILVAAMEFMECGLTAVITPMIPTVVNAWFLPSEHYIMSNFIWLGLDISRIGFSLTGVLIEKIGWESLFYISGGFSLVVGVLYYVAMTQDPADNLFISEEEKELIASSRGKTFLVKKTQAEYRSRSANLYRMFSKFKNDMKVRTDDPNLHPVPYKEIFMSKMFWLSAAQATAQFWIMSMMVLMNKDFFEEIHGYTVSEAAMLVTLPNNLFMIAVYFSAGHLADFMNKVGIEKIRIRQLGIIVQINSVIPMLTMTFLPCSVMEYKEVAVFIQIFSTLRGFGNLAGYSSMGDLSPTFQGIKNSVAFHLFMCVLSQEHWCHCHPSSPSQCPD